MKIDVTQIETRVVDNALQAAEVVLEWTEQGYMTFAQPNSDDADDYTWRVSAFRYNSGLL